MGISIEQVDWHARQQDLLAIRHAVFVTEQGVPLELERDEYDPVALHLLATDEATGEPVATARLLPDGHIGRMAVLRPWRNRGIGSALLRRLLEVERTRGHARVVLSAQCHAEPFYQRLGFRPQGEIYQEAGIDHREMSLPLSGLDD